MEDVDPGRVCRRALVESRDDATEDVPREGGAGKRMGQEFDRVELAAS